MIALSSSCIIVAGESLLPTVKAKCVLILDSFDSVAGHFVTPTPKFIF